MASGLGRALLRRLERQRAEGASDLVFRGWTIALVTLVLAMPLAALHPLLGLFVLVYGLVAWARGYARHGDRVRDAFKRRLMPRVMKRVDPGLDRYEPWGLPLADFRALALFKPPDGYRTKDLVAGTVAGVPVRFAMVRAEEWREEGKGEVLEIMFEGVVFIAEFHKHFRTRTHVRDGGAGFRERLGGCMKLEDPRFNAAFTVTAADEIEARYLLTPDLMERLLGLKERFTSLDVVFQDECICLALGAAYDVLEPDVDRALGSHQVDALVAGLKDLLLIVEHLELDTRIWSRKPVG